MDKLRSMPTEVSLSSAAIASPMKAKTAPGVFSDYMVRESEVFQENERLKRNLDEFAESSLTKKIDSTKVIRSKWANRHQESFTDTSFMELKSEIDASGGNIQPIKVRPLSGEIDRFEIVFGHRRHQACLELGLPVLAMIEEISDIELFNQMDRENRQRKDMRPYEQGLMYAQALDCGLFPSAKKMASEIGVDLGSLGRSLAIARLPDDVLNAFRSPLEIQIKWSTELIGALKANQKAVLSIAKELRARDQKLPAKQVLAMLIAGGRTVLPPSQKKILFEGVSGQKGSIELDEGNKRILVDIKNVNPLRFDALLKLIEEFFSHE
jgi:ParB family chromosome partitioning protein